ncbi:MAG: hypothetical protein M0D57_06140 [Sphingobacteriales bacterium JAD_PAG50586_3]|nr:MAG: hypothetical protein M0D57_06140 [Sphingobacteriales bacterium JAD_PAG50586_3]
MKVEKAYPTIPTNETQRLEELYQLGILDTVAEAEFDNLTKLAAQICGTPISLVSLVDVDRQWFKSKTGLDASETPREFSFAHMPLTTPTRYLLYPTRAKTAALPTTL